MTAPLSHSEQTVALLHRISSFKPLERDTGRTPFERRISAITNTLRWIGATLFILLLLLWLPATVWDPLRTTRSYASVVLVLSCGAMLCAILWMVLDALPAIVGFSRAQARMTERQLKEANHDLKLVDALMDEPPDALAEAKSWMEIDIDRLKGRIGVVMGQLDKLAIFSLAGMGWSVWNVISKMPDNDWESTVIQWVIAFLGGTVIGAMVLRARIDTISYHRDLLALVIARRKMGAS